MRESTRRHLVSLLFCLITILNWGFATFLINLRAYIDEKGDVQDNQPVAISVILAGIGSLPATAIFLVAWSQRPLEWIQPLSVFWSLITGILNSFGLFQYIVSADDGMPASIAGPVAGLHVLVPPLWYVLYYQKCINTKTILGFVFSLASLVLFSGILSHSGSFPISMRNWLTFLLINLGWGIALITQGEAGKDVTFKQFPQLYTWMTVGFAGGSAIYACAVSVSDVGERSFWVPFGVDQILTLSAAFCNNLGIGFFSLCLCYAEDFNLMVALTSLNIIIPGILGILVLDETPTWNILTGLVLALAGMIVLSFQAKQAIINSPIHTTRRTLQSISSMHLEAYKIQNVDRTALLFEPCLETSI